MCLCARGGEICHSRRAAAQTASALADNSEFIWLADISFHLMRYRSWIAMIESFDCQLTAIRASTHAVLCQDVGKNRDKMSPFIYTVWIILRNWVYFGDPGFLGGIPGRIGVEARSWHRAKGSGKWKGKGDYMVAACGNAQVFIDHKGTKGTKIFCQRGHRV